MWPTIAKRVERAYHAAISALDSVIHERLLNVWTPSAILAVLCAVSDEIRSSLPEQVSAQQGEIYATFAGVGATVLGFLIAGAALLAVLPQDRPLVRRLRGQGFVERAIQQIGRTSVAISLLTGAALLGTVIDQPPDHPTAQLSLEAYWIWTVAFTAIPSALLLGRSVVALNRAATATARAE